MNNSNLHLRMGCLRVLSFTYFVQKINDDNKIQLSDVMNYILNPCYPLRVHSTSLVLALPQQGHFYKTLYNHICQRFAYHLQYRIVCAINENKNCNITFSTIEKTIDTFIDKSDIVFLFNYRLIN